MSSLSDTQLMNPFVGLRAFEESEDYLFFGRTNQISELLKKLSDHRFIAVIGSSGSGKSSLMKSGLLPAIYSGFVTVGSNWRTAIMRPGEDPIGYLAQELAAEGTLYAGSKYNGIIYRSIIESSLRRSENGLIQVYKDAHLDERENLLVVVDQFEELFRFSKYEKEHNSFRSEAVHFIKILLTAAQQKEYPLYVLLTMRADFLGECAQFRGLPEAINQGQYLIPRMTRDEIREAVTGPVAVSTATISQRLVTRLLNEVNNDTNQLPILQHALMRTWDAWYERNQPADPIDSKDYEKIGTMQSALSQHADEAYAELVTEREQRICELMFKALTDNSIDMRGTRRPRSIADLCLLTGGTQAEVMHQIEIFRKPGRTFLMPPGNVQLTGSSIIDISHESLMRVWDRLVRWTEEEARSGDVYLRLAHSAQLKEQGQRGLLKNPELELALNWKKENNPTAKWAESYKASFEQAMDYLEESRKGDLAEKKLLAGKEATRKRLINSILFLLGVLLAASAILTIYFNGLKKEAYRQKNIAEKATHNAKESDSLTKIAYAAAVKSEAVAKERQYDAYRSAAVAKQKQHEADSSAAIAQKKQYEADSSARIAEQKTAEALAGKLKADTLLKKTVYQNFRIAANEYARLIREGPSEENKNKDEFYGSNYLLAYQHHFDQLEDLYADEDLAAYKSLKNKIYYNNELYQRAYEGLGLVDRLKEVVKKEKNFKIEDGSKLAGFHIAKDRIRIDENRKFTIYDPGNTTNAPAASIPKTGQEFISFTVSKKLQQIFCSTNDNLIYAFDNNLKIVDVIYMGARVTALDFNEERSIIYFGTSGGYVGYIDYGRNKTNQPAFENKLESEITTIRLFTHTRKGKRDDDVKETFLLATGLKSSPKVYKLDESTLKPDVQLSGNTLPYVERQYGKIYQAAFDPETNLVMLVTSNGTYSWNPFTYDLMNKLKTTRRFNPYTEPVKSWINKPDIKFY